MTNTETPRLTAQGRANVLIVKNLVQERHQLAFGWDEMLNCWDDADYAETFGSLPNVAEAVKLAESIVDGRSEAYAAATMDCDECSQYGGES